MSFGQYRSTLVGMFRDLLDLADAPEGDNRACHELQLRLLKKVLAVERRVGRVKRRERDLRRALGSGERRLAKSEAMGLRARIARCEVSREDYGHVLHALRSVGDGVAFTYFDRFDLKPMVLSEHAGFLSGKAGLKLERDVFRRVFEMGRIAIWNDLTTCLRHGDLTVRIGSRQPFLIEVKGGRATGRTYRQARRLEELSNYLSNDVTTNLFGDDKQVKRVALSDEISDHSAQITALLRARSEGIVSETVEPGLVYVVAGADAEPQEVADSMVREIGERPLVFFLNEMKWEVNGYLPFTLSMRDPEGLFSFYKGDTVVFVVVDTDVLLGGLRSKGLDATLQEEAGYALTLTGPNENLQAVKVSRHFITRVAAEFVRLDWLVGQCASLYRRGAELASTV